MLQWCILQCRIFKCPKAGGARRSGAGAAEWPYGAGAAGGKRGGTSSVLQLSISPSGQTSPVVDFPSGRLLPGGDVAFLQWIDVALLQWIDVAFL